MHSKFVGRLESSYPDRFQYISSSLNDHSSYTFVTLIRHCSDISHLFNGVAAKFCDVEGGSVNKLHTDGAQEYIALQNSLKGGDAGKSLSSPYTPELNRIAERVNRTMVKGALSMLIQSELPSCLWPNAVKHTI